MDRATAIAAKVWNNPCDGNVALKWVDMPVGMAAYVNVWLDTGKSDCTVNFNVNQRSNWVEFCSTMIHEYGHVAGYRHPVGVRMANGEVDHFHSPDSNSIMFPYLFGDIAEVRTPNGKKMVIYGGFDKRCANRGRTYLGLPGKLPYKEIFR